MTWRLIVEAQAEAEIQEAAAWYGRAGVSHRESFLRSISAALAAIKANPLQYQIVRGTVRRALVDCFPYAPLYSVAADDAVPDSTTPML